MGKKIVIVLVLAAAGAIGLGFALGWFDWDAVRGRATDEETWATVKTKVQMEKAKLEARVDQLTGEPTGNAAQLAQACRQNLRRIESAKRAVASRTGVSTGSVSWDAVLKELGGQMPKCPAGGEYTLNTLEQLPRCSKGANGTPDTADDHLITSY